MWELNDEEKATENIKPISFMGYNLNELGEVEGAIPVLRHFTDELHDRIIQEHEGYVYKMCMQLEIDPDVLKKQLIEIRRLNTIIREKDEQIEKMKNVGNCKHSMNCAKWNEKQTVLGLMKFCLNCKDWELAE
ncbi:MAG: hypothetical protein MJZ11_08425 [Lachnospiraceae bacterium]|nr:hypothetical protein [Lachnospiraceae bacterium]